MKPFPARYNDGIRAVTYPVEVRGEDCELIIVDRAGDVLDRWPAADVRLVDPPTHRGPWRLGCGGDDLARLVVADARQVGDLRAVCPHLLRTHRVDRRTVLRVAAWIAAVVFLIQLAIPLLATQIAAALPPEIEREMGRAIGDRLVALLADIEGKSVEEMACEAGPGTAALDRMVARLVPEVGGEGDALHLRVIDSDLVNAFALPGGHILLPRAMVAFAETPNALAGVLAHEIGHIELRHPTTNMIKIAATSFLIGMLVGDIAGGTVIATLAQLLIAAEYTQEAEREADDFALALLNRSNIDARPLAVLFDRLGEHESGGETAWQWFSTHPSAADRVDAIARRATGRGSALDDAGWRDLQGICGGVNPTDDRG